ncbi:MAG: MoxR family ATPase, partial [Acutalibacteraceae bacterium]
AQSFRDRLLLELPQNKESLDSNTQFLTHRAKALIKELAAINFELAQLVVSDDKGKTLPEWFMVEIVRDLPRLIQK